MRTLFFFFSFFLATFAIANEECDVNSPTLQALIKCSIDELDAANKEYKKQTENLNNSLLYDRKTKNQLDALYKKSVSLFTSVCEKVNSDGAESQIQLNYCIAGQIGLLAKSKKIFYCIVQDAEGCDVNQ